MYIKSLMLLSAFGIAMTTGMVSNHFFKSNQNNSNTNPQAVTNQDKANSGHDATKKSAARKEQESKSPANSDLESPKIEKPSQPPKDAIQNIEKIHSVHMGFSHADLQTTGACTSCHQAIDDQAKQFSPYFLGYFSNVKAHSKNEVDVAFLGVNASDVPSAVRSHLDLKADTGAIVNNVVDESPAYHCGIEQHDVLVSIDKQPVAGEKSLLDLVRARKPGTKILVEYIRAGKKESCNLVLGKQKTARILSSFRINGCEAQLTSATNCQSCHAVESK